MEAPHRYSVSPLPSYCTVTTRHLRQRALEAEVIDLLVEAFEQEEVDSRGE